MHRRGLEYTPQYPTLRVCTPFLGESWTLSPSPPWEVGSLAQILKGAPGAAPRGKPRPRFFLGRGSEKTAPREGIGGVCPPGSHRNRNRKPQAGIYSKSSAPDHIVLSVVHLFWGHALKSLLPESAPGRPSSSLLSQETLG